MIAEVKNIGYGDKAEFNVRTEYIRAYVQAKASTTPRSMVADKRISVDTVEVSARPAVNIYELRSGRRNMAELIREANIAINNKKVARIQQVLAAAVTSLSAPYYASGSGVVKATFDPLLLYYRRQGGAAILGDIAVLDKLRLLTGFTDSEVTFSQNIIDTFHRKGAIDGYNGSPVIPLPNAYVGKEEILDPAYIYIMSVAASPDQRCLKIVNEGDVLFTEATHIDNLLYEVRLDQLFGAAYLLSAYPTLGVYEDTTL
jgi:hypothetical protein